MQFLNDLRTHLAARASALSAPPSDVCFSVPPPMPPSPLLGKRIASVKSMVTAEEADEFAAFARKHGYGSVSDCLRDLMLIATRGVDGVTNLHRDRLVAVGRNWPGSVQEPTGIPQQ